MTAQRRLQLEEVESAVRRALESGDPGPPGPEAQLPMAPRPRPGWAPGRIPPESRPGAALVLIYPREGTACVLLTVRAKHLPNHRGQVSFPGGAVDPGESAVDTALREAREEVGIDASRVRIAGELSPLHIPASGFALQPVVAFMDDAPALAPAPDEVERILEVPLDDVTDPARHRVEAREIRGEPCDVPYFDLGGEKVWGATAMVLCELIALLGVRCDPWGSAGQ